MALTTGDKVGIGVLCAAALGGGAFIVLHKPAAQTTPQGQSAPAAPPQYVQGTQPGAGNGGNANNVAGALISGIGLWNNVAALWGGPVIG